MPKKDHVPLEKRVIERRMKKYRVYVDFISTAPVKHLVNNYYQTPEEKIRMLMRLWRRHLQGDREIELVDVAAEVMELE